MLNYYALLPLLWVLLGVYASYNIDEDVLLDTVELLKKYGYPAERHFVTTEDGYILQLHRVPFSPLAPPKRGRAKRVPVIVAHGMLGSSADWVIMGPGRGLAYVLADAGCDVWLMNFRGNTYSRNHTSLRPSEPAFWAFSWHEGGVFDLPAAVEYVLDRSSLDGVVFVGHSLATTKLFVMASERPEYSAKLSAAFALSPVAYLAHMRSPLFRILAPANRSLKVLTRLVGINEFLPSNELISFAGRLLCQDVSPIQFLCENALFLFAGFDSIELNSTMLPVIMSHAPAGTSAREFLHLMQIIDSGQFRHYNYGTTHNRVVYGSHYPPKYSLLNVTAPVALHYSDNDWISHMKDVDRIYNELPNPIGKFRVSFSKFNHLDYLWAIHAKEYVYNTIINLIQNFE